MKQALAVFIQFTRCRHGSIEVAISEGGTWTALSGTVTGAGNFEYEMDGSANIPTTGTIDVDFDIEQYASLTLPARTWGDNLSIDVQDDQLVLTMGSGKHYITGEFEIIADNAAITTNWTLNCSTNDAEFRSIGKWFVNTASFKQPSQFILTWGNGTHIFYSDLQLGLFGAGTNMSMNAGDSNIILYANQTRQYVYRLSRVKGFPAPQHDTQTWNNIFLLRTKSDSTTSIRFIEGFNAAYMRWELLGPSNLQVRGAHTGMFPARNMNADILVLIGSDDTKPVIGQPANNFGWAMDMRANNEAHVFGNTIINLDAGGGIDWDVYNCELSPNDNYTDKINFYDRNVRRCHNKNILNQRQVINPEPVPDLRIEKVVQGVA